MPEVKKELDTVKRELAVANLNGLQTLRKVDFIGSLMGAYSDANAKFAQQLQREGCLPELVCPTSLRATRHVQLLQFAQNAKSPCLGASGHADGLVARSDSLFIMPRHLIFPAAVGDTRRQARITGEGPGLPHACALQD